MSVSKRTGTSYYTGRLAVSPEEMDKLRPLKLVPGMPVEVFVQTGMRTVMSYLFKPIGDQITKSFRQQ